ncbi:hypothetical protein COCC4DRAFT_143738 [Bipolaris maydis ATCC 48331]|uniref:SET domain-containing protein n=2 Tax=Cochliobolus heterostrophus TaxID=5016 RepID=M2UF91_COCH5|nr:uncharacterized protein COCC4DRAFT_143738 [Bipolaris maydis ATCC 48331]EMD86673.1 hypothetical protein COCHEDRAFT_1146448 [Bipolaris maydis C5]KAJ5052591.1 hypothetical protein J3E74DRAFT_443173 [Bipolaris maydis]ENI03069.1 hypothetical protein COCC4DRAFT_143738 [Bipolaris maydis ATCC 48331]KAJ6192264.1 hypothetical protein J3E72DRAFT_253828 [Bipolaris maydis]KAJ6203739.1 hypothetical protein PSV09DRAFT_1146448 [Bipolaris maydis]
MDVCKDLDNFGRMLKQQKCVLQNAKQKQGQCPRDRKGREEMLLEFMMASMATSMKQSNQTHMVHSSFVRGAYPPCTVSVDTLKSLSIGKLRLETHHRGASLLLRTLTAPNRMTGILVLVEDQNRDVTVLQLYRQRDEHSRAASDIIGEGSILIIKEPFFKVMASGEYGIRVDHVSDVMFLDKDDLKVPQTWRPQLSEIGKSADALKLEGNTLMGKGKYWKAIQVYSNSLASSHKLSEIEVIKRNRALAYLKTQQYDAALSDTGFPNFGKEPSEKTLFRAAEALYHLARFEECRRVLETLCNKFPHNEQAVAVLRRARGRCTESSSGIFDFKLLQAKAKKHRPPHMDYATYMGPVEVRETRSKGRGVFATKSMKVGDLILCEKAFAHAYIDEVSRSNASITLLMNVETETGFLGGQADLIRLVVQKLYSSPSTTSEFTNLYHGDYKAVDVSLVGGKPVVDTFLVEWTMALNVFGCPISSLNWHRDIIANRNKAKSEFHSCGIWTKASYVNHSCIGNVSRSFIGDMMIIRAAKDLEADTELKFPCAISDEATNIEQKFKNWGFVCSCARCEDIKSTKASVFVNRRNLQGQLRNLCDSFSDVYDIPITEMERLLKALRETYTLPAEYVPRLSLWEPQLLLTRIYMGRANFTKGMDSVGDILNSLGFIFAGLDGTLIDFELTRWGQMVNHLVEVFLHARTGFSRLVLEKKSNQAEYYAKLGYLCSTGRRTCIV